LQRAIFAVQSALVALQRPVVLRFNAGRDFNQPAMLSLDTLGVSISRTPAPVTGRDHADTGGDHEPVFDDQGDEKSEKAYLATELSVKIGPKKGIKTVPKTPDQ
jgi:hypothetical protein